MLAFIRVSAGGDIHLPSEFQEFHTAVKYIIFSCYVGRDYQRAESNIFIAKADKEIRRIGVIAQVDVQHPFYSRKPGPVPRVCRHPGKLIISHKAASVVTVGDFPGSKAELIVNYILRNTPSHSRNRECITARKEIALKALFPQSHALYKDILNPSGVAVGAQDTYKSGDSGLSYLLKSNLAGSCCKPSFSATAGDVHMGVDDARNNRFP